LSFSHSWRNIEDIIRCAATWQAFIATLSALPSSPVSPAHALDAGLRV
jgi:hypothetical protein